MADQALHRPERRGSPGRRGAEVPAAIIGSIALHALVLGYLALRALSDAGSDWTGPIEDPFFHDVIRVELVPFTAKDGRDVRVNRVVPYKDMALPQVPAERSPDFHPPEQGRRPMPQGAAPKSANDAETWRLPSRPGVTLRPSGPWGGDVCRDLSNLRAWLAANCQDRAPPPQIEARGSPPLAEARSIGQRRLNSSEQRRENGFARQAAANEAWRSYRREDGAYPGLLSMLRDQ